jgi:histidyl-tRNA synthetase
MDKVSPPRGMRDTLPEDYFLRDTLISVIRRVYESYGYVPIDTPVPERIEYLTDKAGGENEHLMFKLLKRGDELKEALAEGKGELADLGLRYDLTVPTCRFYATNQAKLPKVFRRYHIAPVWRAERPAAGRFREFYQCDVDVIGDKTFLPECEVILATCEALRALDLPDYFVKISDRRILPAVFRAMGIDDAQSDRAMVSVDKLDKMPVEAVLKESAGYLTGQQQADFARFLADLTAVTNHELAADTLGEWGRRCAAEVEPFFENLRAIRRTIDEAGGPGVPLRFWPTLARGMGYYTGPIFEVWDDRHPFSLAGGGRYDQMLRKFLGQEVPACGFSIGFERILTVMKERGSVPVRRTRARVLVGMKDEGLVGTALRLGRELREAGIPTEVHPFNKKLGRYFEHAEGLQIPWVVLVSGTAAAPAIELGNTTDRNRVTDTWENILALLRDRAGSAS